MRRWFKDWAYVYGPLILVWGVMQAIGGGVIFMDTFGKDRRSCEMPRTRLFRIVFPAKPIACSITRWLEDEE